MHSSIPEKARRSDGKTEPMPSEPESLSVEATFAWDEFGNITNGFIPENMDDRWFIFYEAPFLYLHRSWTGLCIFAVRFEPTGDKMRIAEVTVNRNFKPYLERDEGKGIALLKRLLSGVSQPDIARQMRKRAREEAQIRDIVAVAEKILAGEMGLIEGSRQLAALGSNTRLHAAEKFLIFRGIDSEAEVLPADQSRQHWNPEVLRRKDKASADYEASVKGAALQACRDLVNTYKSGG